VVHKSTQLTLLKNSVSYMYICIYIYREREIGIICLHKLLSREAVKHNFTRDGRFLAFSIPCITIQLLY